jgi:hypothetical protein
MERRWRRPGWIGGRGGERECRAGYLRGERWPEGGIGEGGWRRWPFKASNIGEKPRVGGGVQQCGAPHGGIREGPDRSPRRQAADNGPRAMGEVGVQAAVQNKDTEVAARWGLGNSAGWRRLNLFRIQIQTDFKSNSNCFRLWLTQKKTFLSSKNLK